MNKNKGAAMEAARQRKAKRLGERGSGQRGTIDSTAARLFSQTECSRLHASRAQSPD